MKKRQLSTIIMTASLLLTATQTIGQETTTPMEEVRYSWEKTNNLVHQVLSERKAEGLLNNNIAAAPAEQASSFWWAPKYERKVTCHRWEQDLFSHVYAKIEEGPESTEIYRNIGDVMVVFTPSSKMPTPPPSLLDTPPKIYQPSFSYTGESIWYYNYVYYNGEEQMKELADALNLIDEDGRANIIEVLSGNKDGILDHFLLYLRYYAPGRLTDKHNLHAVKDIVHPTQDGYQFSEEITYESSNSKDTENQQSSLSVTQAANKIGENDKSFVTTVHYDPEIDKSKQLKELFTALKNASYVCPNGQHTIIDEGHGKSSIEYRQNNTTDCAESVFYHLGVGSPFTRPKSAEAQKSTAELNVHIKLTE